MKNGICPYPGLRPFTEEESIFFKGRDLHIRQIVKLLEENKMAFITGASGDGKSSMVYAGVVPYIRAGFFKAKFNNWIICDFKPQRNPLASLAESTANEMGLDYENTLRELGKGFSSLIDIYINSSHYIKGELDTETSNKGKNLLIIADQFEEVFTNSDNFNDGKPSDESYTAINLLLETVRISIAKNLPVYVIFTMRSDYISNCTVFKNLPEFIAYSQFFVPQLKRTEIRQVIEEPAALAGGSVSTRLTEVIINNLNSGFDQLPVLQHALNLLWKMAGNGEKQLDLIHLAKIAGISKDVLSPEEQKIFDNWFETLPDYRKKYYEKPDLNNVLNTHAGTLYESAYDYFMQNANWAEKSITRQESKEIIETVFKSLTKIDNNRQVRNRCTLKEITGIINKDNITNATVCGVINIFRTPENTLIRPFSEEGNLETQYISGDTVLDVTHEALIRNWKMLSQWDLEEQANLKDYNDFNSQLQRWISRDNNPEYLLTSGSYSYFKNWYDKCRPTPYWFVKYDNSKQTQNQKLKYAKFQYENCINFLEQSETAIQAKERLRKRRIQTYLVLALVFIAGLAGFSYWAMDERKNAMIQKEYADKQTIVAKEQKQDADDARAIADEERRNAEVQAERALESAREAMIARNKADIERKKALAAKAEADAARAEAERNLELADERRIELEQKQKEIEAQITATEIARDSAKHMFNVAISNVYAIKARNQAENAELSLRIVKEAYDLNEKNNVNQNTAELYDAVLFALEKNELISPVNNIKTDGIKAFSVDDQNHIIVIDQFVRITEYSINDYQARQVGETREKYATKAPIEKAIFISPHQIVYSTKDKKTCFLDLDRDEQKVVIEDNKDFIESACITPDKRYVVLAYQRGTIVTRSLDDVKSYPIDIKKLNRNMSDVYCTDNEIFALSITGIVTRWNFTTENRPMDYKIIDKSDERSFALAAIPDKHLISACFSDGSLQFLNTKTNTREDQMLGSHSKLEHLVYCQQTGILAMSSADKRISLINTNNFNEKPLFIEEHSLNNSKVKNLYFNKQGVLYALTDDNMIHYWRTNIRDYDNELKRNNPQPLSEEEKSLILGREFSKTN